MLSAKSELLLQCKLTCETTHHQKLIIQAKLLSTSGKIEKNGAVSQQYKRFKTTSNVKRIANTQTKLFKTATATKPNSAANHTDQKAESTQSQLTTYINDEPKTKTEIPMYRKP